MKLTEIVKSRQYAWDVVADAATVAKNSMNKGGRAGVAPNPLYGRVSSRKVFGGMAASADMLLREQLKLDPNYKPSDEYEPRFEATEHECVVRSLSTGQFQVRIMKPRTIRIEWYVDGQPASPEQLALIKQYKRARTPNPLRVKVMFPYVDNIQNLEGNWEAVAVDED